MEINSMTPELTEQKAPMDDGPNMKMLVAAFQRTLSCRAIRAAIETAEEGDTIALLLTLRSDTEGPTQAKGGIA
jgi:hypothetical protein